MSLPSAVHHRLDRLADLAGDVKASRAEIVAMLIAEAELDTDRLEHQILAYRKKLVRDVIPADKPGEQMVGEVAVLPVRAPGRPKQRSGA